MNNILVVWYFLPVLLGSFAAFDMTADLPQALEDLVSLGIERVLTSGGETSCLEGLPMLTTLVKQVGI